MRITLAVGLILPLFFFVFLVVWFQEAWLLAVVGAGVYLYILGQFFIFKNPRLLARGPGAGAGTAEGSSADGDGVRSTAEERLLDPGPAGVPQSAAGDPTGDSATSAADTGAEERTTAGAEKNR